MNALSIATGGMITPSLCALLARRDKPFTKPASAKVVVQACEVRAEVKAARLPAPVSHQLFATPEAPRVEIKPTVTATPTARVSVGQKAAAPVPPGTPTSTEQKPTVTVRANGNGRKRPKLKVDE